LCISWFDIICLAKMHSVNNVKFISCHNYSSVNKQNHNVQSCKTRRVCYTCLPTGGNLSAVSQTVCVYAAQLLLVQHGIIKLSTPPTALSHLTLCGFHLFNG
jgi:hypothetical protein